MGEVLPKFGNPPVIETVLGVSFAPLTQLQVPHFGLFWSKIRKRYTNYSVQPPLPDRPEEFGQTQRPITIFLGPANFRCWYVDDEKGWLVQLQNSQFVSNWRRDDRNEYPHYETFLARFDSEWQEFKRFLNEENIGVPELYQAQVLYVNHIDISEDFGQLDEIFPVWSRTKKGEILNIPDAVSINAVYVIPPDRGRLYINAQPVISHSTMDRKIQLTLTANVLTASNDDAGLEDAMNLAHQWVVSGFADFTTPQMHKLWERKQ